MQLKVFLSILTASLLSSSYFVRAQQHVSRNSGTTTTIIVIKKKKDTVAPAPEATEEKPTAKADKKKSSASKSDAGYGPVPLAGTRSYFGDKDEFVKEYTRRYLAAHSQTLNHVQNACATPFSVIDTVLRRKQLPKELKYLAVIESALNRKAVSKAGAVGPWQLMESTAKMMGLSVNHTRDDRTDWYKSTAAATRYLEMLYGQLNDWLLVIAAYNSGPVPVQKAIKRTGSTNFWDIKEYLPRETQGHVLAFIATASIFENLNKFIDLGSIPIDFRFSKDDDAEHKDLNNAANTAALLAAVPAPAPGALSAEERAQFTEEELSNMTMVRLKSPIHLDLIQKEVGIDKKMLERWNDDYNEFLYAASYPEPYYNLKIPKDKLDAFLAKKDVMTKKSAQVLGQLHH